MRLELTSLCTCLLLFAASNVIADNVEQQAREAFKKGVSHYNAERYEEALAEFQTANSLKPGWKILYNIAQCQTVLKRYGLAIDAFEQYLAEGGDEVETQRRDEVLAELERLRLMVGTVMLEGPENITVYVDDVKRGETPIAAGILVAAGFVHEFRFELKKEVISTQSARVRGEMTLTLKIDGPEKQQAPAPAPVVAPPEPPEPEEKAEEPAPVEPEKGPEPLEVPPPKQESKRRGIHPAIFWSGVGLTGALATGVLIIDLSINDRADKIETQKDLEQVQKLQGIGGIFVIATGVSAVATGVLAIFTRFRANKEHKDDEVSLGAWSNGNSGGVSMTGSF